MCVCVGVNMRRTCSIWLLSRVYYTLCWTNETIQIHRDEWRRRHGAKEKGVNGVAVAVSVINVITSHLATVATNSFASPTGITNLFSLAVDLKLHIISTLQFRSSTCVFAFIPYHVSVIRTNECRRQEYAQHTDKVLWLKTTATARNKVSTNSCGFYERQKYFSFSGISSSRIITFYFNSNEEHHH